MTHIQNLIQTILQTFCFEEINRGNSARNHYFVVFAKYVSLNLHHRTASKNRFTVEELLGYKLEK